MREDRDRAVKVMNTVRTEEVRCPNCRHLLSAHTATSGERYPRVGDISLCAYCAVFLEFASIEPLRLDLLSSEKYEALSEDERRELHAARDATKHMRVH